MGCSGLYVLEKVSGPPRTVTHITITFFSRLRYFYTGFKRSSERLLAGKGGWSFPIPLVFLCLPVATFLLTADFGGGGSRYGIIGGPDAAPLVGNISEAAVINQQPIEGDEAGDGADESYTTVVVTDDSLLSSAAPFLSGASSRGDIVQYTVKSGDTVSAIAAEFGISPNTIYWANAVGSSIKPGDALIILPLTGVKHEVKDGDTLESIARLYSADVLAIRDFNKVSGVLRPGQVLVIPNGKKGTPTPATSAASKLPSYPGYYLMPTTGWNWGRLHAHNAVDIANKCGIPIFASADGLVIEATDSGAWNSGYGNYITIEHSNGTQTRYAHTQKNNVEQGSMVKQGDIIAYIGNTGKTHGVTGCHLHFEVQGARNPFAR